LVGAVWQVVAAGDALGVDVRLAAGVNFKNLVKYRWVRVAGSLVQNVLHAGSKLIATNVAPPHRYLRSWHRSLVLSPSQSKRRQALIYCQQHEWLD